RRDWAGRSSGLHRWWLPGDTDDLPERGIEPIWEGRTPEGDTADRSRVAAKAEPAGADRQLRTGESRCLGVAEQVGDEGPDRFAGSLLRGLDAGGEGRDAPFRRTGGGARQLRRSLGSTTTSCRNGIGQGHQLDRAGGARGVVG